MNIKITKGIEAAGVFPYGFMSKENKQFLNDNIGRNFNAQRIGINGYELDVKLSNNKNAIVHIYNAIEIN